MRGAAILSVILSLAALVLTCLCLFAGSKTSFLADVPVITLNTSDFGQSLLASDSSLANLLNTNDASEVLHQLGLHDFYTANLLGYCEGYYKDGSSARNYTYCSPPKAFFQFDPAQILQTDADKAGFSDIDISSIVWPSEIQKGLSTVHAVEKAAFILYCVSIALIALATLAAAFSVCLYGRLSAFINVMTAGLAFICVGLASAVVTVAGIKGNNVLNQYGAEINVASSYGTTFLILTWVATVVMVLSSMMWCVTCIVGNRSHRYSAARFEEKPAGY